MFWNETFTLCLVVTESDYLLPLADQIQFEAVYNEQQLVKSSLWLLVFFPLGMRTSVCKPNPMLPFNLHNLSCVSHSLHKNNYCSLV